MLRILFLLTILSTSFSSDFIERFKDGNGSSGGGNFVQCDPSIAHGAKTYELLDYYEVGSHEKNYQLAEGNDFQQIALGTIRRIERFDPVRYDFLKRWIINFLKDARILYNVNLTVIDDTFHLFLEKGCSLIQVAVQRNPLFKDDPRYFINGDVWEELSEEQKAGLVLHEVIYREYLSATDLSDDENQFLSPKTRRFNKKIASLDFLKWNESQYSNLLKEVGLAFTTIVATSLSWELEGSTGSNILHAKWENPANDISKFHTIEFFENENCSGDAFQIIQSFQTNVSSHTLGAVEKEKNYTFRIHTITETGLHSTSDCSPAIFVEGSAVEAATNLSWSTAPFSTILGLTANWKPVNNRAVVTQVFKVFSNDNCSGKPVKNIIFEEPKVGTAIFGGRNGETYTFQIVTSDSTGTAKASACSSPTTVDLTNPKDPTFLNWNGGANPSNHMRVKASWKNGGEDDIASQTIQFHKGSDCRSKDGTPIIIKGAMKTTQTYTRFFGPSRSTHSFEVYITDFSGRTSNTICVSTTDKAMVIDDDIPVAPVVGNWSGTAFPTNSLTNKSNWTISSSADVAHQTVYYYTNSVCSAAAFTVSIPENVSNSDLFTGVDSAYYYYRISATDDAGNESALSACSPALLIDTTAPAPATNLVWNQSSPTNAFTKHLSANWKVSSEEFILDQEIEFYIGVSCSITLQPYSSKGPITNNSIIGMALNLANGGTYTYRIRTTDTAGNSTESECSVPLVIDNSPPVSATTITWVEASPHHLNGVNAVWTSSSSVDAHQQKISYFRGEGCKGEPVLTNVLGIQVTDDVFLGENGGVYTYTVTTIDHAGNETVSSCSSAMSIDSAPPVSPTAMSWDATSGFLEATWIPSISPDSKAQVIYIYSGSKCHGRLMKKTPPLTIAAKRFRFDSPSLGESYTFNIHTVDAVGNTSVSQCSKSFTAE